MTKNSDLSETERELRTANSLKSRAESGADDLTEDDVAHLYRLLEEGCDSWEVTRAALDALNTIAKKRPDLLKGILPQLIQHYLALPSGVDEGEFAFEDVSTDPNIGIPMYVSWVLHNIAEQTPALLSAHTNLLTDVYWSDTNQPYYFLLALGRLADADPNGLPVDAIRADLDDLSDRDDWYATKAEEILTPLE